MRVTRCCIDSSLENGSLTYGECYLPGAERQRDINFGPLLPSVSGQRQPLGNYGSDVPCRGTGEAESPVLLSISVRSRNDRSDHLASAEQEITHRIRHGIVLSGVGNADSFHYKKSRRGNAEIDRAVTHTLKLLSQAGTLLEFSPYGYDERQYCSPGFNLPVGCLMRSVWGTFPEYHTSADDLNFICPERLAETWRLCLSVFDVLENNRSYRNLNPYCEPQLGRRNLYGSMGGGRSIAEEVNARLWVLNFSDGEHSLLDIAERSGIAFAAIQEAAELLFENKLLALADDELAVGDQSEGKETEISRAATSISH